MIDFKENCPLKSTFGGSIFLCLDKFFWLEAFLTPCVRSGQASGCRNVIGGQSGEYEENVTHNIYLEVSKIKLAGAGE